MTSHVFRPTKEEPDDELQSSAHFLVPYKTWKTEQTESQRNLKPPDGGSPPGLGFWTFGGVK